MCYVEIPKIGVYLPVEHGTSADTLEKVGWPCGRYIPASGRRKHPRGAVRPSGMASSSCFRTLTSLQRATFYIHVLGEALAYKVDAINTVLPTDTSLLQIADGKRIWSRL